MNPTLSSNDELLDIVDENDHIIGQEYRSLIYQHNRSNFRAINGFIINDNHQLWIPRRAPTKKLFPLCLDASVGGHVAAGETYQQAFERELYEELFMKAQEYCYELSRILTPHEHGISAFMHVYSIKTNETPRYNSDDIISAQWYDIAELKELIQNGEKTKGDLPYLLDLLFL